MVGAGGPPGPGWDPGRCGDELVELSHGVGSGLCHSAGAAVKAGRSESRSGVSSVGWS